MEIAPPAAPMRKFRSVYGTLLRSPDREPANPRGNAPEFIVR
jgi:hypothetical protein